MNQDHFVIIGNGPSANTAADYLRDHDPDARITLISDEFFLFYYRHKLKDYILGDVKEDDLIVQPHSYYKDRRIRLRLGQKLVKTDLNSKTLFLQHMEKVHYSKLLICCGGKPRIPEIYYPVRDHFTVVNTLSDARKLRETLDKITNIVIVGGDLISLQMTKTFLSSGKNVYFMIDKHAFWPLELTEERRDEFKEAVIKMGAMVFSNGSLQDIESQPNGRYLVRTETGETLGCDLVCAFFGLDPNVDFLVRSGLDIDRGILVDEFLQTAFDDVFASGDCAQVYNPNLRNYWVSIGWANAKRLGEVAAHNMLGSRDIAGFPPQNVLHCSGITIKSEWWQDF